MFDTREPARRSGMPLTRVIKRQTLVELFQAGLAAHGSRAQIHFDKNLLGYEQRDGKVTASFADGTTAEGDVRAPTRRPPPRAAAEPPSTRRSAASPLTPPPCRALRYVPARRCSWARTGSGRPCARCCTATARSRPIS